MRTLPAAILTALADRRLVARDFLWIIARNRSTGAPEAVGFWSDVGSVNAAVIDPNTGLNVANIGTVNAGILQNPDGKMTINILNGTIEIWD